MTQQTPDMTKATLAVDKPYLPYPDEHLMVTHDLDLFYGEKQALKGVTLPFDRNEITALIGPSGCGKSTYLRCLNLMNREIPRCRFEGPIYYKGKDINTKDIDVYHVRQNIGMVFQQPNPFQKSIYDNIAFAPKRHGITNKEILDELVESSLRRAALWDEVKDKLDKSAMALSGGQQQRLCIARTVAMKPDVILLDEPCSALDPISTLKIEELFLELKEEYCLITVTHNMEQAKRIADKTAFFLLGEMVEFGTTTQIFTDPHDQRLNDYLTGRFG